MGIRKAKHEVVEPMPRSGRVVIGVAVLCVVALAVVAGKFYLANWRGEMVFLPFALFLGVVLIAALFARFFRKHRS